LVPVIFRYFFPFVRNSRHVSHILTEGTRRGPHPTSSLLRRHLKTAEDPHINRSFTRTQDLPDTWLTQLRKSGKTSDSAGVHWRVWLQS
jgi:hypothetical protein